jgi:hypothetical protein
MFLKKPNHRLFRLFMLLLNKYNLCSINGLLAQKDQNPAAKCGRYTEAFKKGPIK